jgi:phospholipid/cholesterol/gamma-HCH transport system substrate-binding protein
VRLRALVAAALVCVAVPVAIVVFGSGGGYSISAIFPDAGQLVRGDLVQVAGRNVGKVSAIRLTGNGQASVELSISSGGLAPLHRGTIAQIRAVGLSSIANRFVDLSPGPPNTPEIPDGGTLPASQTRGIVDLDVLLNSMTPTVRRQVQDIVGQAAEASRAPAARQMNAGLAYLNPALSQTAALGREVLSDQTAIAKLVDTGSRVTGTLAEQRAALGDGLQNASEVTRALAAERTQVGDVLARAPASMRQAQTTLAHLDALLPQVNAVLRDSGPTIGPLTSVLRRTGPLVSDAEPALGQMRTLLQQAKAALEPLPELDRQASPAIESAGAAFKQLLPIVSGLRAYTPDLIAGFFGGFGGRTGGYYDANGHYVRISLQGSSASFPGLLPPVPPNNSDILGGYRTGLTARCPGGAEEPAPDHSNPWQPPDMKSICNPGDDHR